MKIKLIFSILPFLLNLQNISHANALEKFNLKKDLEIGKESDELYSFSEIADISVDKNGNIYIFDYPQNIIKIFNDKGIFLKIIGGKGEGPGEFPEGSIFSMAVDSRGRPKVLDRLKKMVHEFKENGEFLVSWRVKLDIAQDILIDSEDNIIIVGVKNDKIFHVYKEGGKLAYSFGTFFKVPPEYERYKGWRIPIFAYFSDKTKKIYACHPFYYEIWAFTKDSSEILLHRKSDFFKPFDYVERFGKKLKIRSLFPIFEKNELLLVVLPLSLQNGKFIMEIFKNYKYIGYLNVKGYLKAMDSKGRLYFVEEEDYTKVVRYVFEETK